MLAPRNGYLPLLEPEIQQHFAKAIPSNADSIWFDYQGLPLKWYDACDNFCFTLTLHLIDEIQWLGIFDSSIKSM